MRRALWVIVAVLTPALALLFTIERYLNSFIKIDVAISATAALISSTGVIFLGLQLFYQNKVFEAQFVQGLAQDVDQNVYTELLLSSNGKLWELVDHLDTDDRAAIIKFLTFFERLNFNLHLGVGSLEIYDKLFSYRFFILVHNPNVQKHILLNDEMTFSWTSIFILYRKWLTYKMRRGLTIPRKEMAKELMSHAAYKAS